LTRTTRRILLTGACGQIGSELTLVLRERYGDDNVVATDIRPPETACLKDRGPFEQLDVCDRQAMDALIERYKIDTVYHMAAILSATGEEKPNLAWDVNMLGLINVLEVARERKLLRVFCPSSIGYPGVISSETPPGGGTTDYAVDVFYQALQSNRYVCFVRPDTVLPMMYMPDCIKATLDLMDADFDSLSGHCNFNIASMSFSAEELVAEIKKHIPGFVCEYEPDFRQAIADSWPRTIDDAPARTEWGWHPQFDLASMTVDMLKKLAPRLIPEE